MKSELEKRLTRQLSAQGHKDAEGMAHALLVDRGHIKDDGTLTTKGAARSSWTGGARQGQGITLLRAGTSPARIRVRSKDE